MLPWYNKYLQIEDMNRTIKFRGKSVDNGEWLYGNLIQRIGRFPGIMFDYEHGGKICYAEQPVDPDTIGQFTGLLDRVGAPVYEGDILRTNPSTHGIGYVSWNNEMAQFVVNMIYNKGQWYSITNRSDEIIGNVTDHPELLEK